MDVDFVFIYAIDIMEQNASISVNSVKWNTDTTAEVDFNYNFKVLN